MVPVAWLTIQSGRRGSCAIGADELTEQAEVFSTELVLIDEDTTRRSLAEELRWSAAYHRLAQRL
jgi:L-arabinose isomerase